MGVGWPVQGVGLLVYFDEFEGHPVLANIWNGPIFRQNTRKVSIMFNKNIIYSIYIF